MSTVNGLLPRLILAVVFYAMGLAFLQPSLAAPLEKTAVCYRKVDGHKIFADVYRPRGNTIHPVIVNIHGGALIMGNRDLDSVQLREYSAKNPESPYFDVLQYAEENGYALVSIDYRLAPETA